MSPNTRDYRKPSVNTVQDRVGSRNSTKSPAIDIVNVDKKEALGS